MEQLDDSENNAKISDSGYSNSCSNSQSRRSHSSKSTHSGSNSSGSSGYGRQASASTYSNNTTNQPPAKKSKDKDGKKKTQQQAPISETLAEDECRVPENPSVETAVEEPCDVDQTPSPAQNQNVENGPDAMEISTESPDNEAIISTPVVTETSVVSRPGSLRNEDGFSCVISMHDGVVMYTTTSVTNSLGFPKDMWIGRSFIDFVHPRDRNTFASQISSGLAIPKSVNGSVEKKVPSPADGASSMVCRIRRYRSLTIGFGVKDKVTTFMPFLLKFSFKNIVNDDGKAVYLVIQATPYFSAFKTPNEVIEKPVPFVIRHRANGLLDYIDPESVPYLGYLPQELADKDAMQLYHPDDLVYLRQLYEVIVKEGSAPRGKPYRLIAQNGDYLKVETEWSSFINLWSRKLEFVISEHHIVEGPQNPDVFQSPPPEAKASKANEAERNRVAALRENIIRTMNEVLTKPAEAAKQQMTKRCQDLATFMQSLMEDQPKPDSDTARLDVQEAENNYYERDSVMLGGISPHHEYDSKSSTETPLSYTQINYNSNIQRYFDRHQFYDDDSSGDNACVANRSTKCLSPVVMVSELMEMSSYGSVEPNRDSSPEVFRNLTPLRLTEQLLIKHNQEMERELIKNHRDGRTSTKTEREKNCTEARQKKKEHLARCNASFEPTAVEINGVEASLSRNHGLKRQSTMELDTVPHKHRCPSPHGSRSFYRDGGSTSSTAIQAKATYWQAQKRNMNPTILGVGVPHPLAVVGPPGLSGGMFPMYYTPAPLPSGSNMNLATRCNAPFPAPVMMYGSPVMYQYPGNVFNAPIPSPLFQTNAIGLARSNYEEACKQSNLRMTKVPTGAAWRKMRRMEEPQQEPKSAQGGGNNNTASASALNRSTEAASSSGPSAQAKRMNNEEIPDRTDGESSYSSFYSSFFKTESGSAEDSGDGKKKTPATFAPKNDTQKVPLRKMEPPWMEKVSLTSELIYKYQIVPKSVDEVLKADKLRMTEFEQPSMVNEQLGQLYADLQLEGVAARLTLEEGITSSSSSGEDSTPPTSADALKTNKPRRKREYSKLVMIYEENAPLPPPSPPKKSPASCSGLQPPVPVAGCSGLQQSAV